MTDTLFAGSGALTRFILRRDRFRLLIWVIGLSAFIVALVPVFKDLLQAGAENRVMEEMMRSPAMVALLGPVYGAGNYNAGAAYGNMMLVISVMIAGVMNIFLVTRHTRQDEEMGRLEVIRSLPVGRLANLLSAMAVSLLSNVALTLLSGFGLYAMRGEGMDFSGCMLFGASMGCIGIFFAAATALFCQLTPNNRTASGLSFMLLLALYMMRTVGDMGTEALSLISPLGLVLRTQCFVSNLWWPITVILLVSAVIALAAFALASMRDLGQGLFPERPGRRHASRMLSSPFGLALRLLKASILVWAATVFLLAAMYGSTFGHLESFISDNAFLQAIFTGNSEFSLTEQFIALLMAVISMVGTIPVLSFMQRVSGEERLGHTEHLLARAVSRNEQFAAYFLPAVFLSVLLQFLSALGFWAAGSVVLDTAPSLGSFIQAAFAYLPAIWVMLGLSMVFCAYLPDKTSISYIYLGYSVFSIYLGTIAGLPPWTKKLTPFGYIPQLPVEEMKALSLIVLTVIAIGLGVLGFAGYRKRDMRTQ